MLATGITLGSIGLGGCAGNSKCGGTKPPFYAQKAPISAVNAAHVELWHKLRAADPRVVLRGSPPITDMDRTHAVNDAIAREIVVGVWDGGPDAFAASYRQSLLAPMANEANSGADADELTWALRLETARADIEVNLPWGASRLIEAQVFAFTPAASTAALAERDTLLSKHLRAVTTSLETDDFDALAAHELDDWLDPLEKMTVGYTQTQVALADLRVALTQFDARPTLTRATPLQQSASAMLRNYMHGADVNFGELETKLRAALATVKSEIVTSVPSALSEDGLMPLAIPLLASPRSASHLPPTQAATGSAPERQEPQEAAQLRTRGDAKMKLAATIALALFVERGLAASQLLRDRRSHKTIQLADRFTRRAAARPAECIVAAIEAALALGPARAPGDFESYAIDPRTHH